MLNFICKHCNHEMSIEDEHAGKRADCPGCGRIITIPNSSSNIPLLYNNSFFKSEILNDLFIDFLDEHEDDIIQQKITKDRNNTLLVLEVRTKPFRSQIVTMMHAIRDNGEEWLGALSSIGEVTDNEELYHALRLGRANTFFPTYSLTVEDDLVLKLGHSRRLVNVDSKAFYDMTIHLACIADFIEEEVFSVDER